MIAGKLHLYHWLQQAAHRVQKAADRALLDAAGVTTAQAAVLALVGANDAVSQREVARRLGVNESAMTAMTSRLIGLGLIARRPASADARAWSLSLTGAGHETLALLRIPFRDVNQRLEAALPGTRLESLCDGLRRVADAFNETSPSGEQPESRRRLRVKT